MTTAPTPISIHEVEPCQCGHGRSIVTPTRYSGVVKLQDARQVLQAPDGLYTTSPAREIVMPVQRTTLLFTCAQCGGSFERAAPPSRRLPKYCSSVCSNIATGRERTRLLEERFWEKVNKAGPIIRPELGPCWIWTGQLDRKGYGRFSLGHRPDSSRRNINANKQALEWQLGRELKPEHGALHRCDNPPCVRNDGPNSHLFEGTRADNAADRVAKGRSVVVGLSPDDRLEIIRLRTQEEFPWLRLSRMFGVHRSAIQRIVREATGT